jgi:hypothetical protein
MSIPAEVDVETRPAARTVAWATVFLDEYQLANPQTDLRNSWRPSVLFRLTADGAGTMGGSRRHRRIAGMGPRIRL